MNSNHYDHEHIKELKDLNQKLEAEIVARKKVEAALQEKAQFLDNLINTIPNPIFYKDAAGIYRGCNTAFEKYLGLSRDKIIGKSVYDMASKELADKYSEMDQTLFRNPGVQVYESKVRYADDTLHDVIINKATFTNTDGSLGGLIGVILDITERKATEEVLRKSEKKYRNLYQGSRDGYVMVNMEGNVLEYNKTFRDMLGYSDLELATKTDAELTPEKWHAMEASIVETQIIPNGFSDVYEKEYMRKDGAVLPVALRTYLVRDDGGLPLYMWAFIRDITDSKKAEELLKKSEGNFRLLAENAGDIIWTVDMQMRLTYISPSNERIFGFTKEEAMARTMREAYTPASYDLAMKLFADTMMRESRGENPSDLSVNIELELIHKHGHTVPVEVIFSFLRDNNGLPTGILAITRDISERKQAEKKIEKFMTELEISNTSLKLIKYELEAILDNIPGLVFFKDTHNNFIRVNKHLADAHHLSKDVFMGKNMSELYEADIAQKYWDDDLEVINSGKPKINIVEPWDTRQGRQWVLTSKLPYMDKNGKITGIIGVSLDITERINAEDKARQYAVELERSNRELQDFAYIASHDLQAPLRKIQSFGELLKKKCHAQLTDEGRDYIDRMQRSADNMSSMIESLLEYSQITSKHKPFMAVDLNKVIEETLSVLDIWLNKTGGRVEVGVLPVIEADLMQMRQLMQNLTVNAIKFQKPGVPPVVHIYSQTVNNQQEAESCRIFVQDNGIGFDEKYLDLIFQPFKRLHGKGEYEGSGVGLAICQKIVEKHNGSITAKSIRGEGATFVVTLPVKQK